MRSPPMLRAAATLLVLAYTAGARAAPDRHVDPDAIREVRRVDGTRFASPRAISHYLEARRSGRAGDVPRAAEHLRLAIAYDEASPELRVSLAQALAELGQLEPAAVEARRAVELGRDGPAASEAHVLLGRIATANRSTEQAILAYRHAVRIETALSRSSEPPDPEPWLLLAAAYVDAGDEAAAVRTLEDLAARAPGDGGGFRELGRAFLDRRDPGRAERHLHRAVELDPRDVETHRLLAQAHEALRRDLEAKDDLVAILREDPEDEQALLALGRMAVRRGDFAQAREWFHRHVRAAPAGEAADAHVRVVFQWLEGSEGAEALAAARAALEDVGSDPRLHLAHGLALQELRRWAEAAEALGRIRPEAGDLFVPARVALAEALSRAGRHAEAERSLAVALESSPLDARLLTTRAILLDRAGRAKDSVALLRHAVAEHERRRRGGDLPELYAALAESLVKAGRPDEAISTLRAAAASRPTDETLLYAIGSAYERAGQPEAAVAQMRALIALNPDHAEALNFVGYALAEEGVRLDEAEKLVRRALELKPRAGHVLDSLGWVFYRRGEHRRAVEVLEQADQRTGPDSTILEHLGDAYRAVGRLPDAARAYRRALASVSEEPPEAQPRHRAALERKLRELGAVAEPSR